MRTEMESHHTGTPDEGCLLLIQLGPPEDSARKATLKSSQWPAGHVGPGSSLPLSRRGILILCPIVVTTCLAKSVVYFDSQFKGTVYCGREAWRQVPGHVTSQSGSRETDCLAPFSVLMQSRTPAHLHPRGISHLSYPSPENSLPRHAQRFSF